ncbi:hypothetical protein DIPPA_11300 [Diplonema papillatum]|nr:hypothetical protein DIPPA_11300 [Diplonema papillatum]
MSEERVPAEASPAVSPGAKQRKAGPPPPPESLQDAAGRTVVPSREIGIGNEVEIVDLLDEKLNGRFGIVSGRQGTGYFISLWDDLGGTEVLVERNNLEVLEPPTEAVVQRKQTPFIDENAVQAVRVFGMVGECAKMNGLYRKAGIKGSKFEQRLADGVGSCVLWRDTSDKRWKLHPEDSTSRGWQASSPFLLGQWSEDPEATDGSLITGRPYPFVCKASAAEHCHTSR